ncbi:MAG: IcmP [uncultured bacterium]|nr:MAG: IcmP [uncultured bacterium]
MPEQQQQSGQDTSLDFLWVVGFLIGGTYLAWYFGREYIVSVVFHVRFYEITAVGFLLDLWAKLMQFFGLPQPQFQIDKIAFFIQHNINGVGINFSVLTKVSAMVGEYTKYPFTLLLFGAAALLYFGGASHNFHHIFTTQTLKKLEQENWPQIKPVLDLDLVNEKLDKEPWAMALSPMAFCKKHDLLDVEKKDGKYIVVLRRGAAYRLLSLQLGPKWYGAESLPPHLKALFAVFAARIEGDKKNAEHLLDQFSASAASGKLNIEGVEELMHKHMNAKNVSKIMSLHGYITTMLASMLVGARATGVLASSEFIWLKPMDRRMWYMLNSVGRPTAVAEISGAFAHWLAEKKIGLPLMVPMVEEAVNGLELAVSEMIYKPDEE